MITIKFKIGIEIKDISHARRVVGGPRLCSIKSHCQQEPGMISWPRENGRRNSRMPALKIIAHVNPLTYLVDGLRSMMLGLHAGSFALAFDFAVLAAGLFVLVLIGGRMYPRLIT